MSTFSKIKLGEVVIFQRGFDITKAEQTPGEVPIISSSGISSTHNKSKSNGPGVIIGRKGTLGTVHFVRQDYWPHDTTLWVKDFKGNNPQFMSYFLRTLKLENFDTGASNPTLNRNHIHKIKVIFPKEPATQRKIAAILTVYDDLIETNKRRIALLEKMAEEIYREWFVRMRFPGYKNTKFVKGVPEGWDVRPIASFCKEIRSGVRKRDLADDEIYIGLEHIPRKSIAFEDWATGGSVDSNKLRFKKRDILFCKIRPYLHKVALTHFNGACSSDAIVLRPCERLYEGFLLFTVFSQTFIDLATAAAKGTKMPRADWAFLEKLEIKIPPSQLMESYQSKFEDIFSLIETLLQSNRKAIETRDLLLPRLISGKLSVEDLDIQFPPSMCEDIKDAHQKG